MAAVTIVGVGSPVKWKTKTTFREISPAQKNPPACGTSGLLDLMTTHVRKTEDRRYACHEAYSNRHFQSSEKTNYKTKQRLPVETNSVRPYYTLQSNAAMIDLSVLDIAKCIEADADRESQPKTNRNRDGDSTPSTGTIEDIVGHDRTYTIHETTRAAIIEAQSAIFSKIHTSHTSSITLLMLLLLLKSDFTIHTTYTSC